MTTSLSPPSSPTVADLMSREVLVVNLKVPLRAAVKLLAGVGGPGVAAVVDDDGRCVGTLTAGHEVWHAAATDAGCPPTCVYQNRRPRPGGGEVVRCTLPEGACPVQRPDPELIAPICSMPNTVLSDWQQVPDVEAGPTVGAWMKPPILAHPDTSLAVLAVELAGRPADHVIVIDAEAKPVGLLRADAIAGEGYLTEQRGVRVHPRRIMEDL